MSIKRYSDSTLSSGRYSSDLIHVVIGGSLVEVRGQQLTALGVSLSLLISEEDKCMIPG